MPVQRKRCRPFGAGGLHIWPFLTNYWEHMFPVERQVLFDQAAVPQLLAFVESG